MVAPDDVVARVDRVETRAVRHDQPIFKRGVPWSVVEGALTKLGLQFSKIDGAAYRSFEALKNLASQHAGPLLVKLSTAAGDGHAVLVAKTTRGVKIIDRYGVFNNLDDLARHYGRGAWCIDAESIFSILNAVVDESLLRLVNQMDVLGCLVRQSVAVFDINHSRISTEALDADFEKFLASKGKKRVLQGPETVIVGGFTVEVALGTPNASSLSGIAKAQYGDFNLWPLIYDLNKDKIGPNPNRLKPGTKLLLLPLQRYTATELAEARHRAPSWRSYPL
jgi:hypothetical protein